MIGHVQIDERWYALCPADTHEQKSGGCFAHGLGTGCASVVGNFGLVDWWGARWRRQCVLGTGRGRLVVGGWRVVLVGLRGRQGRRGARVGRVQLVVLRLHGELVKVEGARGRHLQGQSGRLVQVDRRDEALK